MPTKYNYNEVISTDIPTGGEPTISEKLQHLLELQSVIDNVVAIIETRVIGPKPEQDKAKPDIKGYVDALAVLYEGYEAILKRLDILTRIM